MGHIISARGSLINIEPVIKDMKVRTNVITHQFYSIAWQSKVMLFNSQCMSLYGCQLWNLDDPRVDELSVAWRVCCRRLLALHPRTRSHLLPHIMNSPPVRRVIEKRMLSFFLSGLHHPVQDISIFFKNALVSSSSYMLTNVNSILNSLNVKYYEIFDCAIKSIITKFDLSEGEQDWQTIITRELLSIRDRQLDVPLTYEEVCEFLDETCTA